MLNVLLSLKESAANGMQADTEYIKKPTSISLSISDRLYHVWSFESSSLQRTRFFFEFCRMILMYLTQVKQKSPPGIYCRLCFCKKILRVYERLNDVAVHTHIVPA